MRKARDTKVERSDISLPISDVSVPSTSRLCDVSVPSTSQSSDVSVPSTSQSSDIITLSSQISVDRIDTRMELLQEVLENEKEEIEHSSEDEGNVVISKKRFRQMFTSNCGCISDHYVDFREDAFESSIKLECVTCGDKDVSEPIKLFEKDKAVIWDTNAKMVYSTLVDDIGRAGMNRFLGALGKKPMGAFKYYRYLNFICDLMDKHYSAMQPKVHRATRKYYERYTDIQPDDNGDLCIDVSYDGSLMKRMIRKEKGSLIKDI